MRSAARERGTPAMELDPTRLVKVFARLRDIHPDFSLNYAMLLFSVAAKPGQTQRELYTAIGMHNSGASRALAVLSNLGTKDVQPLGLVSIDISPEDRRERLVKLTPKGQRLVDDILRDLH